MRWGGSGNISVGAGATAHSLASRDESTSYYYYQEPSASLTASANAVGVHGLAHRAVSAKKPRDKRPGRRIVGSNARFSKEYQELKAPALVVEGDPADSSEPESTRQMPVIMCSGKSVYGTTSDSNGSEDRDNNDSNQRSEENNPQLNNPSDPFRAVATNRISEPSSSPRHRTDEELEQIIRDLRDQVFQSKQTQGSGQRKCAEKKENPAEGDGQTQRHHRKHLKNPLERMEDIATSGSVTASVESKLMANNGLLLQRPHSSCHLNRLVAESSLRMVVPAVIYDAPGGIVQATERRLNSSNIAKNQISSMNFRSINQRRSRNSEYHPGENQSFQLGEGAVLNPRHVRLKPSSACTRIRRPMVRDQARYDPSSDCGEGFLYLVDADDSDDDLKSCSLSPVGPWIVDDLAAVGFVTTETLRSPSVSTCYSVSSLESEDLENKDGDECELAAMSPRSRLLYFSACDGNNKMSRSIILQGYQHPLCRSATCGSGLVASTKLMNLESRAAKPERCWSAHVSTRGKLRTSSSSTTGISKLKARSRVIPTRKRPQSGGIVSSRSGQRVELTTALAR